ncbi:16S rRNA (adenine(1518)-N(6)/adenine(1519)-N(6))-dimethyltransferase RsmA [Halopseudomonas sp.]|jgi:16S rRNA (adenine1518-N6/adenine1519-N6)-dimethyltransferase|uniref:16S rRNA (adenine(1518)-N(6)/adenine(1519)-N(6))- dimethyltransferase RsmA n=1 Tax=Halopseudomonas sp. TaxID=2901191 RepID=UPI0039E4A00C
MNQFAPHRARKRFGQNFLHDAGVINRILRAVSPKEGQRLVEIGPGQGAITEGLLASGTQLDVVELDHDLHPLLLARFGASPQFTLHKGDALKFDFRALAETGQKLRIVGNLPYNISTPLMFHLIAQSDCVADMHFMLQKEVVQRLAAGAGMNHYGRLGIMVQYHCQVEHLFDVGSGAFSPAPKVDSAIVRLTPHAELPHPADDVGMLELVVREAFNQRRKTLRNTLKSLIDAESIEAEGIDPTLRPEQIDLAGFVRLANRLARDRTTQ